MYILSHNKTSYLFWTLRPLIFCQFPQFCQFAQTLTKNPYKFGYLKGSFSMILPGYVPSSLNNLILPLFYMISGFFFFLIFSLDFDVFKLMYLSTGLLCLPMIIGCAFWYHQITNCITWNCPLLVRLIFGIIILFC